jgi:hypothetical protein
LFFGSLIFAFDKVYIGVLTLLCAALHELSHVFALFLMKSEFSFPRAKLRGFGLKSKVVLSYPEEIFFLLSGPLSNLFLFLILLPFANYNEYIGEFAALNLFTALCSLVPIEGYDGYGALSALFLFFEWESLYRALEWLSLILSGCICLTSLYFILEYNATWWIFFSFFYSLINKMQKRLKQTIFEN